MDDKTPQIPASGTVTPVLGTVTNEGSRDDAPQKSTVTSGDDSGHVNTDSESATVSESDLDEEEMSRRLDALLNVEEVESTEQISQSENGVPEEVEIVENLPSVNFRSIHVVHQDRVDFITLKVRIEDQQFDALLDTGAYMSLMKKSLVDKLNLVPDVERRSHIYGIGGKENKLTTYGTVAVNLHIYKLEFKTVLFHVVPDDSIDLPVFVGQDFLRQQHLVVNLCRKYIRYSDPKSNTNWELYILPGGSYELVFSGLICRATTELDFDTKQGPQIVPTKISYPCHVTSVPSDTAEMWYYDGEVRKKRHRQLQGYCGIINLSDPKVVLAATGPEPCHVKPGDVLGTVSTVICVDPPESIPVNLASKEPDDDNLLSNLELGDHLTEVQVESVKSLLTEKQQVISRGEEDVGRIDVSTFRIKLYDDTPIYHRPRRFPQPVTGEIEKHCELLLSQNIIEPSDSPFNCRVLPIRKTDGSLRLCMDYRELNSKTIADRYPMANLSEAVFSLHGAAYFTTLDLVRGYYQMEVDKESRKYTAFSTARGHWQYRRMPFGLRNAPAAFQRAMQIILREFPRSKVIVYLDDILIIESSFEKHRELVVKVLNTLIHHGVKIKLEKCSWFQQKVDFLGHEVSTTGVKKDPKYVEKVKNFPRPETVRQLQEFMGLINWQRKFVPNYATIGKPLYALTGQKKTARLKWTDEMLEAFDSLKKLLTNDVELTFPDYSESAALFELFVDASATGAGACLCQEQSGERKVIVYDSHSFSGAQRAYSTIERELAAIRWGVKAFRAFLFGQHFVLHTDHQPLVYLHNMKLVDHRLARTLEDLAEFSFEIRYTPGPQNQAADTFSRLLGTPKDADSYKIVTNDSIPVGLTPLPIVPGVGDSMFAALIPAYEFLRGKEPVNYPSVCSSPGELRKQLISELINKPKRYGLSNDGKLRKHLQAMLSPTVLPFPEALLVFSELYHVVVCVHYGHDRPVIFQNKPGEEQDRVHLQCLAGHHYNPLAETGSYSTRFRSEWCTSAANCVCISNKHLIDLSEPGEVVEDHELDYVRDLRCQHKLDGAVITMSIQGESFCVLLDSGALTNLMSKDAFDRLDGARLMKPIASSIHGIGTSGTDVLGETIQTIASVSLNLPGIDVLFLVVPSKILDTCILLGLPSLSGIDLELNFGKMKVCYGSSTSLMGRRNYLNAYALKDINSLDHHCYYVTSSSMPGLSLDRVLKDQENCPCISQLRKLKEDGVSVDIVPKRFKKYKRHWDQLCIRNGTLFVEFNTLVPLISFNLLVDVVLNLHVQNAHIGAFKLYEMISQHVWNPSLRAIIRDACNSCSICQRCKTTSKVMMPPTIKIQTFSPFELVAMDLVSLPPTQEGYIGILVMVDHYTKWLAVAPIKNKRSNHIIEKLEHQLFPSLLRLPTKILTDNGPEFSSLEFADMVDRLNIHHIKTTAHKPSSNGAVERVNRTVIEFLRNLSEHPSSWRDHLPTAVRVYNGTTHNETKMSPTRYIMTKEHTMEDIPIVTPGQRMLWEEGHPQYTPFKEGQSVLSRIFRSGRLNINKLKDKYDGPFRVVVAHQNKVTYILKDESSGQTFKVHHSQLKPWRNPPKYIIDHLRRYPIKNNDGDVLDDLDVNDNCMPYVPYSSPVPLNNVPMQSNSGLITPVPLPGFSDSILTPTPVIAPEVSRPLDVVVNSTPVVSLTTELLTNPLLVGSAGVAKIPKCIQVPKLSVVLEGEEASSSTLSGESLKINDALLMARENVEFVGSVDSETGVVMDPDAFNWSVSSISLSTFSAGDGDDLHDCENCHSILELADRLERLCLDGLLLEKSRNSYQASYLVSAELLNATSSLEESSAGLRGLFETHSLDSVSEGFSGFSEHTRSEEGSAVSGLLKEISQGLAEMREVIARNRRESLERVRDAVDESKERVAGRNRESLLDDPRSIVRSPPLLRSRGRPIELPHIPDRPLEYKRRTVSE